MDRRVHRHAVDQAQDYVKHAMDTPHYPIAWDVLDEAIRVALAAAEWADNDRSTDA